MRDRSVGAATPSAPLVDAAESRRRPAGGRSEGAPAERAGCFDLLLRAPTCFTELKATFRRQLIDERGVGEASVAMRRLFTLGGRATRTILEAPQESNSGSGGSVVFIRW